MAKPARSDILKNLGGSTSDKCEFPYVIAIYFFESFFALGACSKNSLNLLRLYSCTSLDF